MQLSEINKLLDAAKKMCGSDYQIAKVLPKVTPQLVSDWRAGRKNPQPEDLALVAELGGLNAEEWLARAVVAKHEGTAKGDMLMRALGKGLLATGAVLASGGAHAAVIGLTSTSHALGWVLGLLYTMYRNVKSASVFPLRSIAA